MEQSVTLTYADNSEATLAPVRIDRFLVDQFSDYSRSYFQKVIDQHGVCVNGMPVTKAHQKLKGGEKVTVNFIPLPIIQAHPQKIDLPIVDIQKDFIVVNKPSGLVVHASSTTAGEPTLVDGLLYMFQDLASFEDAIRPGIVHRLDKDTSGLLLVARTPQGLSALGQLFKDRAINKTYTALVQGHPPKNITLDTAIGRHPELYHKMAIMGYNSRHAVTHLSVLEYLRETAVVSLKIETGRTHQIRVHCASIDHSVVGDGVYGQRSPLIKRQALHATTLDFTLFGTHYSYQAPLPEDIMLAISQSR